MELKRVVVTGLGAITPLGNSVTETWQALVNGISGAGPITRFDASKFKTRFACEVKNFDPLAYFPDKKDARKCDLHAQYAIASSQEAIADAKIDSEKEDKDRIGVIFSSGIGGIYSFQEEVRGYSDERGPRFGYTGRV